MTALGTRSHRRTRAQLALLLGAVSLGLLACMADNGLMDSNIESAPPDQATLCKLKLGKTTLREAKAILGKPDVEAGNGLGYTYDGASLTLPFVDGVLTMPAVGGSINFPDCWTGK